MSELEELIREYCEILSQESKLADRKDAIKAAIDARLRELNLEASKTSSGSVSRFARFKLTPHRDMVLGLLDAEDLFAFAQFSPAKVKEHLVPRYGREQLLPLFEVEKTILIQVKRPTGSSRTPSGSRNHEPPRQD